MPDSPPGRPLECGHLNWPRLGGLSSRIVALLACHRWLLARRACVDSTRLNSRVSHFSWSVLGFVARCEVRARQRPGLGPAQRTKDEGVIDPLFWRAGRGPGVAGQDGRDMAELSAVARDGLAEAGCMVRA
jgi:hypothetical protein